MQQDVMVLPPQARLGAYKPSDGHFGLSNLGSIKWYHCREMFHNDASFKFWQRGFYFSLPKDSRAPIAEFFNTIEEQLYIRPEKRTHFYKTNIPTIIYIWPAGFWFRQWMRFSLFSILCRAGMNYNPVTGMEVALRSYGYSKTTYRAIKMFLAGRTRYTGFQVGWMNAFGDIPCVSREKCCHKDRRCRKMLDARLVPGWQVFPISLVFRLKRKMQNIWDAAVDWLRRHGFDK